MKHTLLLLTALILMQLAPIHGAEAQVATAFDVRTYGAVGDDATDNTEAFSRCLKALVDAGGGRMTIPQGVFRGRIVIPPVSKPIPSWITVEIIGEGEPTPVFGTVRNYPLQKHGTILKCLAKSGSAVISADNATHTTAIYGVFSAVYVVLRNLDVRTYDNPGIGGIDLKYAMQCKVENVFINTDVYSVQASKPTHGTSGLITPARDNAALTILRNVVVTGYHTGILVNEHTDGDNINLACVVNGLEFAEAHHASRFGRVGAQRCTHNISVTGRHGFAIEQLDMEIAFEGGEKRGQTNRSNEWQATKYNIDDPKNLGIADINYWVVEGNVGATEKFTRNGGASIKARRIGSAPAENTQSAK